MDNTGKGTSIGVSLAYLKSHFVLQMRLFGLQFSNLFGYGDARVACPALVNAVYGSGILPLNGGVFNSLKEIMSYKAQSQTGVDLILPANFLSEHCISALTEVLLLEAFTVLMVL